MHDDVIVIENDWCEEAIEIFKDPKVAIVHCAPERYGHCFEFIFDGKTKLIGNAHLQNPIAVCKKSIMTKLGTRWYGYHIVKDCSMKNINYEKYVEYNNQYRNKDINMKFPKENGDYNGLSLDIGSWVIHEIKENGYDIKTFFNEKIIHFIKSSWSDDGNYVENKEMKHRSVFESIEKEIEQHPEVAKLYRKYNPMKEAKEIHARLL